MEKVHWEVGDLHEKMIQILYETASWPEKKNYSFIWLFIESNMKYILCVSCWFSDWFLNARKMEIEVGHEL